eukprot:TRINITY_DN105_c1_g2_i1.p1 TRINITY_DN105_c1_g2~~TRINITY_DN105_c1_g2_i1.p1  ORF type:complete len:406 (-),score=156.02 TRINITY_DN105_c1_g2_i1:295-1512(-)
MKWFDVAWGRPARGVVAVGKHAYGCVSVGVFAVGMVSVGVFAGGIFSVGLLAVAAAVAAGGGVALSVVSVVGAGLSISAVPCPGVWLGTSLSDVDRGYGAVAVACGVCLVLWLAARRLRYWRERVATAHEVDAELALGESLTPDTTDVAYLVRNPGAHGTLIGRIERLHKAHMVVWVWEMEVWWRHTLHLDPSLAAKYRRTLQLSSARSLSTCCDRALDPPPRYCFAVHSMRAYSPPEATAPRPPSPSPSPSSSACATPGGGDDVEVACQVSEREYCGALRDSTDSKGASEDEDEEDKKRPLQLFCTDVVELSAQQIIEWERQEDSKACSPLLWRVCRGLAHDDACFSSPLAFLFHFWASDPTLCSWMLCVAALCTLLSLLLYLLPATHMLSDHTLIVLASSFWK